MAYVSAFSIITPLGFTPGDNLRAVLEGRTALRRHAATDSLPVGYTASLFSAEQTEALAVDGYTRFESLAIHSINDALRRGGIVPDDDTMLVLSSAKANVETLGTGLPCPTPGESARRIARAVGVTTMPVMASNACISGVSALVTAMRLVDGGACRRAIVCGADVQSRFVISGFHSLKALSESECRPFDIERLGLNLGEGAATLIIESGAGHQGWHLMRGAVRNDAHHITNPSPSGEGCRRAIAAAMGDTPPDSLAMINTHGTATMYNDQMESKAISLSGLSQVPANALKGYLGHTMGAAGVIETALTMLALEDGRIPGTRGYAERGVSGRVDISADARTTGKRTFLKVISGFGGGNAALLAFHGEPAATEPPARPRYAKVGSVRLTPGGAVVDGTPAQGAEPRAQGMQMITDLYKSLGIDYPRYYKMDPMARLGFVATGLLLAAHPEYAPDAILLCNSNGSLSADLKYLQTIDPQTGFFPSPAHFVYTLPNIITGELAIQRHITGETAFYVLPSKDPAMMGALLDALYADPAAGCAVAGWLQHAGDNDFEADIAIYTRQ